ncbi:TPA: TRAP transporter large permease subunit [Escherichia coli]|nr:TRAP transporter large permease subunit [Escherichia coli]
MHVLNILWVVFGIGLMLVLNLKFKINSMVALLVAALSVGMLAGMDLMSLLHTMKAGFGNTLGELAIIVVFGAVIGKLMVDSGAAHQIAHTLLARLGLRYVQLSVIIIGLIFGLAMFYEVAFIMLVPLIPAIIMISTTIANIWLVKDTPAWEVVNFIGSSPIAMFIAMVVAFVLFGTARGHDMQWVMNAFESAVKSIAMVILIIGAGGVLKQTIIDTGIGDTIGMLMSHGNISPYIMAWLITVLIRLATGQGVVSAMTAAGIISAAILDPATGQLVGVNPALLVLATAAGSNTLTHINDASFWLFKGYFDLSVKDTLKTWGLLELVNSVVGLIIVLIISMVA